jgi:hypothetical protein
MKEKVIFKVLKSWNIKFLKNFQPSQILPSLTNFHPPVSFFENNPHVVLLLLVLLIFLVFCFGRPAGSF